jgi:diketogulonate reductase-like aldo/keto reductase
MTQAMIASVPSVRLHDDIDVPQLGFGVAQIPPAETQAVVEQALEVGYRHFDTAAAYGNEEEVGAALRASGLAREDYFVTSKLWGPQPEPNATIAAFEASLERLGLDHVDLYLLHWPVTVGEGPVETWRTLEEFQREEAVRTIGVSNFRVDDLELLERESATRPTFNQVELHPRFQQVDLRARHADRGIVTGAWSPLAQGRVLEEKKIVSIADRHGRTPAQVVLRWHLQLGNVVVPKSVTRERIWENAAIFDFDLCDEEMAAIATLDRGIEAPPASRATIAAR